MKNLFLTTILAWFFSFSQAATITAVVNNGAWTTNSTWNLNRQPNSNDMVIIPLNKTVIINTNQNDGYNMNITVFGTLKMVGGKLRIGTGGSIIVYGSIISTQSSNDQIRIGSTLIFQGDQVQNGSVLGPQQALGSLPMPAFAAFTPLPVKFTGFSATRNSNDVSLQWSTSEEINANMYEVERSYDGLNWNAIAYIAAAGNSINVNNYSFTDKNISIHIVYYRIKEIDLNGGVTYTSIKSVKTETASGTEVKIASLQNKVSLQFPQAVKGNVVIRFISLSGQVVDQQTVSQPVGQVMLNSKVKGNYIISVTNNQDLNIARQIIL